MITIVKQPIIDSKNSFYKILRRIYLCQPAQQILEILRRWSRLASCWNMQIKKFTFSFSGPTSTCSLKLICKNNILRLYDSKSCKVPSIEEFHWDFFRAFLPMLRRRSGQANTCIYFSTSTTSFSEKKSQNSNSDNFLGRSVCLLAVCRFVDLRLRFSRVP